MSHGMDVRVGGRVNRAAELAALLPEECFPARQDQLLAALVRRRAPTWALWRLCLVHPGRVYQSPTDLQDALDRAPEGSVPLEPI